MGDEPENERTLKQKLLFYTTAFFILLGTFSLFAFLFLVPFVIDPAFTTIFMQFDENPAFCLTVESLHLHGAKNCSWASCREGCTKDIYQCTQIRVNYKLNYWDVVKEMNMTQSSTPSPPQALAIRSMLDPFGETSDGKTPDGINDHAKHDRNVRAIREYDYADTPDIFSDKNPFTNENEPFMEVSDLAEMTGLMGNDSEWYFTGARLFPNVKGCGYPPMLNCTIWTKKYVKEGSNFSCYYSKVDPGLVISDLDMWQNTLNLVYAMAIPIPSFIISVIYLTFAYFVIYNEDEETAPLDQNAEGMAGEDEDGSGAPAEGDDANADDDCDICVDIVLPNGTAPLSVSGGPLTPNSVADINSFGHQLKVKMADEMSRESLDGGIISNSGSLQG